VANVRNILDTVILQLLEDKDFTFTYVEMKFFSMWYERLSAERQAEVNMLVEEGRLHFVNAGWSMHDEACTHYDDMINNMMHGHQFLQRTFGYVPKIGWHIDPFGHSAANPRLFSDMGFDAFFVGRIDGDDRDERMANKTMQWVWKPMNDTMGDQTEIFTGVLQDMYWSPAPLNFDERDNGSDPTINDPSLETYNADEHSQTLYDYALEMREHYRGNHMFVPWGEDFAWANASMNYKSGKALLENFSQKFSDMTILFSNPYQYLEALKDQEIVWPVRYADMFPYANGGNNYWTGFYTSRPDSKYQVRRGQADLHAANQFFTMKALDQTVSASDMKNLRHASNSMMNSLGIYQHHDAVSGTAKDPVAKNYYDHLESSMQSTNVEYAQILAEQAKATLGVDLGDLSVCTYYHGSYVDCPVETMQADDGAYVVVHNPAALSQQAYRFKVPEGSYETSVYDDAAGSWAVLDNDLLCYTYWENTGARDQSYTDCELFVNAEAKPVSVNYLRIKQTSGMQGEASEQAFVKGDNDTISTSTQSLTLKDASKSLFEYTHGDQTIEMTFNVQFYKPSIGIKPRSTQSGAYVFAPDIDEQDSKSYSTFESVTVS